MAQPKPAMPLNLRARPRHGDLPVPFTTLIRDGVPDFRVNDPRKVRECAAGSFCALCGHRMYRTMVQVTGPNGVEERLFPDPPGHPDCMRYAIRVCPFLTAHRARRGADELPVAYMENVSRRRPERMFLCYSTDYTPVLRRETGVLYFAMEPWTRVEEVSDGAA